VFELRIGHRLVLETFALGVEMGMDDVGQKRKYEEIRELYETFIMFC